MFGCAIITPRRFIKGGVRSHKNPTSIVDTALGVCRVCQHTAGHGQHTARACAVCVIMALGTHGTHFGRVCVVWSLCAMFFCLTVALRTRIPTLMILLLYTVYISL